MKNFNIWKIFTIVLVALLLAGGAYYLGSKRNTQTSAVPTQAPSGLATPTTESQASNPTSTPTTSPSQTSSNTVSAGGNIGVFMPYKISVPSDWTTEHSGDGKILDKLTITKGSYTITVQQAGGGAGSCLYPGDQDQPMGQRFTQFTDFQSIDENFRRSGDGSTAWTICHKTQNGWSFPTLYGYITYTTPASADETILKQMDNIVSTIVKQ